MANKIIYVFMVILFMILKVTINSVLNFLLNIINLETKLLEEPLVLTALVSIMIFLYIIKYI